MMEEGMAVPQALWYPLSWRVSPGLSESTLYLVPRHKTPEPTCIQAALPS